jgi:hypothetical protein
MDPGSDQALVWKDFVLERMRTGPTALRSKGKTVQQIVADAVSVTGISDVALATTLLQGDERFTVGDKPSRWVPSESAGLVAETIEKKLQKKLRRRAAAGVAAAASREHAGVRGRRTGWRGGSTPGRGGLTHGRGGAAHVLRARIAVEDTTQASLRYVDQLRHDEDDGEDSEEEDDDEHDSDDVLESLSGAFASAVVQHVDASSEGASASPAIEAKGAAITALPALPVPLEARATVLESYFFSAPAVAASAARGGTEPSNCVLVDRAGAAKLKECALLGTLLLPPTVATAAAAAAGEQPLSQDHPCPVFLNTHQPFCLVTVGVQGGGKSHTLACVLESVLLQAPDNVGLMLPPLVKFAAPQNALVLHYDQNVSSVCEATGLVHAHSALSRALKRAGAGSPTALPRERMVVLVSPSYYLQRKAFYGDYCDVRPLLFRW